MHSKWAQFYYFLDTNAKDWRKNQLVTWLPSYLVIWKSKELVNLQIGYLRYLPTWEIGENLLLGNLIAQDT